MIHADGSFTYTPNPSFSGRDWFTWQVVDGAKQGDYATAFIVHTFSPSTFSSSFLPSVISDRNPIRAVPRTVVGPLAIRLTTRCAVGDNYGSERE